VGGGERLGGGHSLWKTFLEGGLWGDEDMCLRTVLKNNYRREERRHASGAFLGRKCHPREKGDVGLRRWSLDQNERNVKPLGAQIRSKEIGE